MLFKELVPGNKFKLFNDLKTLTYMKVHLSEEVNEGWKGFGFYFNTVVIENIPLDAGVSLFVPDDTEVLPQKTILFNEDKEIK